MTTTYRIDWADTANPDAIHVLHYGSQRGAAMKAAHRKSRDIDGSAYAIACANGVDTGQRVYINGSFSHQDDTF